MVRIEISFNDSTFERLKKLMATNQQQVLAQLAELNEAIVAEKAEVLGAIGGLEAKVAELQAAIDAGQDLTAVSEAIAAEVANVKAILTTGDGEEPSEPTE